MLDFNSVPPVANPAGGDLNQQRDAIRADLLARLESVLMTLLPAGKKRGQKYLVGDVLGSPGDSLEVSLKGETAGLWHDHATGEGGDIFDLIAAHHGLDTQADFARVLEIAGQLVGRATSHPPKRKKAEAPVDELGPATAKWDYLDATGNLIACVYRYDPAPGRKEFRPWDAKRRKMAPPEPRPLYNQPGIVVAEQVILVEGEKCAQALIEAGIVATTAMHGANAPVDKTDWSPLAGKAVLIWPDKDKPGWAYAENAAKAVLQAGAISCDILMPPDTKPEGWDAADALAEAKADRADDDPLPFDVVGFIASGQRMPVVRDMEAPVLEDSPGDLMEGVSWGTEDGLASAFTRRYGQDWRYCAQWSKWFVWTGQRWNEDQVLFVKRRMHLVPFTVTIPAERRDRQLQAKLLTERDGILNWALEGCLIWQREGLQPPESVLKATAEYFEAEDAIGRWMEERCVLHANAKSLTAELFNDWKQWADASGEFIGSQRRFSDLLLSKGLEKWRNSVGIRGYQGIGLKELPKQRYPYADD